MRAFLIILLLSIRICGYTQPYFGRVMDAKTGEPLPFATIKKDNGKDGLVTDLNGYFSIHEPHKIQALEVSYLGYNTLRIAHPKALDSIIVRLHPSENALNEVVFKPPYEKIKRILNTAIAHRNEHNPDMYDWYQCRVYYKMAADLKMPDSSIRRMREDTTEDARMMMKFLTEQHLLLSETYSLRTWKKPQNLQEEVIATRLSGFKKSLFTSLVTDVLPFHAYSDYLTLNAKDYHNPVAKGYQQRYDFNLNDEIIQGSDTLWILGFRPKSNTVAGLKGTVYINSNGYAIAYLLATSRDEELKRTVKLEQQYTRVNGKWFPRELNYILQLDRTEENKNPKTKEKTITNYTIVLKGNSQIDSVNWKENNRFKFDKAHTIKLLDGADEQNDTSWQKLRPEALDQKEQRTYEFNDSIVRVSNFERFVPMLEKIVEGKFPVKCFDVDLKRVFSYNRYEGLRLGLGLQTNEKISKRFSVGGWFGYGLKDENWKYGGFAEFYADAFKDFTVNVSYDKDLRDPGRIQLHPDLDKNYLRRFLMFRVDEIEAYSLSIKKRTGYLWTQLSGKYERIRPQYEYAYTLHEKSTRNFSAKEISLQLRYAFAERRAPLFGKYYNTDTKYPVLYGKITTGMLSTEQTNLSYIQVLTAVSWQKHLNRIGNERLKIVAGKSWSEAALPLSKLFAGNGLRYDQGAFYFFGGMLTIYPYEYYTDQFINAYWQHEFDWRFYNISFSAPSLALAHNILWGSLKEPSAQELVSFKVPETAYHESGLLLNNIVRVKYMSLYYFSLNAGYFYHWTPSSDFDRNGRFVIGFGVDF